MNKVVQPPRLIAWELTRACPLACRHCRASAVAAKDAAELSTAQCLKLIDNIVSFAKPTLILTGGEPLLRNDWFVIASYATSAGLPVALATCGLPVNDQSIEKMKQAGVRCVSISIDGAAAESHDAFRQKSGAFEACILAARRLRSAGMDFQVNTTVSRHNISELNEILKLAKSLGASVFNPFLLVPTGRAQSLANLELSADQYEQTLVWLAGQQDARIQIRVTCAPHYQRIIRQLGLSAGAHAKGGCLGGKSFAFISHVGEVQICGFLDVSCGDLRTNDMNFAAIWRNSPVLQRIRDVSSYGGKCGCCEYVSLCGGCRARANAVYGDWLAQEPFCTYQPGKASPDENDLVLMNAAQVAIPPVSRPFEALGGMVGMDEQQTIDRLKRLMKLGMIRRVGAVFDARKLGFVSTLVAARAGDKLAEAADLIIKHKGVTHCYQRMHEVDLWFTLSAAGDVLLQEALDDLSRQTGLVLHSLPAVEMYKSRVVFQLTDRAPHGGEVARQAADDAGVAITEGDKRLIHLLQGSIPLTPLPFDDLARDLALPAQTLLAKIQEWLNRGVIKRIAALPAHNKLGINANAMAVFDVKPENQAGAGKTLAALPEVTHCYLRDASAVEGINGGVFAMFHGRDEQALRAKIQQQAELLDASCQILFTGREFKKTSMEFF